MDDFRVYLMIGFLGSGKSTWAKKKVFYEPDTVIVNRDALRTMLFGKYSYNPKVEPTVKYLAREAVKHAAFNGLSVVIDETNLTKRHREEWVFWVTKLAMDSKRKLHLQVIHCTESAGNVGYRCQGGLRGLSVHKWTDVFKGMKERFESVTGDEFPSGTYYDAVVMREQ